jgi:hypothetical protein
MPGQLSAYSWTRAVVLCRVHYVGKSKQLKLADCERRREIRSGDNIKMDSTYVVCATVDWIQEVRIVTSDVFCEHGNKPSGSKNSEEGFQQIPKGSCMRPEH